MSADNFSEHAEEVFTSADLIARLQARLLEVLPVAKHTPFYALLDFPNYPNVGDSLIWLGADKFLRDQYKAEPRYVCSVEDFDPAHLKKALPEGPIYLSGGGNFGDLWPKFQKFRIDVLRNFPDRHIIQLPQTVHFSDAAAAEQTRKAIESHGNFSLFVRDVQSRDFAKNTLNCDAILAPDLAFWLGPIQRTGPPSYDVAVMLREDKEQSDKRGELSWPDGTKVNSFDWIFGNTESLQSKIWAKAVRRQSWFGKYNYFRSRANYQLNRGVSLLSSGSVVVTDRLHGHILSVLLDIPNVISDNSYGKIKNFHELWTLAWPGSVLVGDMGQAYPQMSKLLAR